MYDIAVIGAGPAGVSAVINAMALNKSCLWISGAQKSDKVMRAELIKNYPESRPLRAKILQTHCTTTR